MSEVRVELVRIEKFGNVVNETTPRTGWCWSRRGSLSGRPDPRVEFSIERGEGQCANPEDGQVVGQVVGEGSAFEKDAARTCESSGRLTSTSNGVGVGAASRANRVIRSYARYRGLS